MIGKFRRLVEGHARDGAGRLHDLGISRENTVHVGPDLDFFRIDCVTRKSGSRIAAIATKRRDVSLAVLGDEAGEHDQFLGPCDEPAQSSFVSDEVCASETAVTAQTGIKGVHGDGSDVACGQCRRHAARTEPLAERQDIVQGPRAQFTDQ